MKNSRRRKQNRSGGIFKFILFLIFLGLIWIGFGRGFIAGHMPSAERKELAEWLEVSGDEVRMYLNNEADFTDTACYTGGKLYLPIDYVHDKLNSRFFWSDTDEMLSYTLPDETVDIDMSSERDGALELLERDGRYFVQADTVTAYSHIVINAFCGEDEAAKRVFIDKSGTNELTASLKGRTRLRTKRDVRSPLLCELDKGETVKVTDRNDTWCSVVTDTGYSGFVRTKKLSEPVEQTVPDNYAEPEGRHTLLGEKVVLAWHGIYGNAANAELDGMIADARSHINVISPTWIQISGADGSYINYSSRDYIAKAHAAGCKVWVCVDNFNQTAAVSDFNTGTYFKSAANRRDFIARLMQDAASYGYDGFNLDFEGISPSAGESYAQFFRELSVECRKAGIVLSVDNYVPYNFNDFYRMDEQGVFADYVVVMLYDEHTKEPGSNSSLQYVDYGLDECFKDVEPERTIAALPLYTRLWSTDSGGNSSSETMGLKTAAAYVESSGMTVEFDELSGQKYAELVTGGNTKQLWLEDADSLAAKMNVVRENNAGGIALWRLGYDTSDIWSVLDYRTQG